MQRFNTSKVWFQRAVVPRKENLGQWVEAFQKETNASHWHYLPWNIKAVEAIMQGFRSGPASTRFGERVNAKLGAEVTQVILSAYPALVSHKETASVSRHCRSCWSALHCQVSLPASLVLPAKLAGMHK